MIKEGTTKAVTAMDMQKQRHFDKHIRKQINASWELQQPSLSASGLCLHGVTNTSHTAAYRQSNFTSSILTTENKEP